jgi:hypothetical protein
LVVVVGLAVVFAVGLAAGLGSGFAVFGFASVFVSLVGLGLAAVAGLAALVLAGFGVAMVGAPCEGCANAIAPATASGQIVPGRIFETNGGFLP